MALPDYLKHEIGTAKSWKSSGGDYAITLTSLANGAGRGGAKGDLGATFARRWGVMLQSSVASTVALGTEVELYWAASLSGTAGTENAGDVSGTDAGVSDPLEVRQQLLYVGSLVLTAAATTAVQRQYLEFLPPSRYGSPVVVNASGQALGSTAADHEIRMYPIEEAVQDTV